MKTLDHNKLKLKVKNYAAELTHEQINIIVDYCIREGYVKIDNGKVILPKDNKEKITKEWITEWVQLFPTSKDTYKKENLRDPIGGKYGVKNKMEEFIREFDYDLNTIMLATKSYLKNEKMTMYRYTKRAANFISKRPEASRLAAECEKYITEGDLTDVQNKLMFGDSLNK